MKEHEAKGWRRGGRRTRKDTWLREDGGEEERHNLEGYGGLEEVERWRREEW